MALADEKIKQSTTKVTLVTLEPARLMTDLLALNGAVYDYTFVGEFNVFEVQRNGVTLTEDSATPTVNDHWYYDETTGLIEVKLAAAPSTSNNVVVFHRIYLRDNYSTDDSLDIYHDRLSRPPSFSQSISNVLGGVMTIAKTNISILNSDSWFSKYLTQDDSFNNKSVEATVILNGETVNSFSGKTGNISITQATVGIEIFDNFFKLNDIATMGDTIAETKVSGTYRSVDKGKNIEFVVGRTRSEQDSTIITQKLAHMIKTRDNPTATCVTYNSTINTSNNRDWALCRYSSNGMKAFFPEGTGAVISSIAYSVGSSYLLHGGVTRNGIVINYNISNRAHSLEEGDSFQITNPNDSIVYHAVVVRVNTLSTVSCMITDTTVPAGNEDWTGAAFGGGYAPALTILQTADAAEFVPRLNIDFTISETTTSGGNKSLRVDFVNNFESSAYYGGNLTTLSPDTHEIYYRVTTDLFYGGDESSYDDVVLKSILDATSITYDSPSFVGRSKHLAFTIPYYNESSPSTYLKYAQDILSSTAMYMYINPTDYKANLGLLDTGTAINEVDDEVIIEGSLNTKIQYNDLASEVRFVNRHIVEPIESGRLYFRDGVYTADSVKYLHGIDKRIEVTTVLLTAPHTSVRNLLFGQRYKTKYKVSTIEIDAEIGDERTITSTHAVGQDSTINGNSGIKTRITSIKIGSSSVDVEATNI